MKLSKVNLILYSLLVFIPITILFHFIKTPHYLIFACSCFAIIPLAKIMGDATEKLASTLGNGPGALLNATFGNAAELIIGLMALFAGHSEIVKASITGSIIGNILLVLGLSIFLGGLKFKSQSFNQTAASMGSTLLILSAISLIIPAVFHSIAKQKSSEIELSLEISIILFITYIASLIFSLRTHSQLYRSDSDEESGKVSRKRELLILLIATVGTAIMSEFLVGSIEETAKVFGMTDVFIGVILVAIIGNAAEHSTAILMARKNKLDLSINIAISSSVQVALFLAPVLVFAGAIGGVKMDLIFTNFEVISIVASVAIVTVVAIDGEANWMEGFLLLAVYAIIGLVFYHLPQ